MAGFYNLDDVLTIPIKSVLNDLYGIDSEKHGDKYVCAIRTEKTKSCTIYPSNTYYDFGSCEGGNVIALVRRMENVDFADALARLAEAYGIEPIKGAIKEKMLSDYQFRSINISPELATKNFDIDIEKYGITNTRRFVEKYYITVKELEAAYPKVYHNMLRNRALTFVKEKQNDYYYAMYSKYQFYQEFHCDLFADKNMIAEFDTEAAELTKCERFLSNAITKPELLKFEPKTYSAVNDLKAIINGTIECQMGSIPYNKLKELAVSQNQKLVYRKIPWKEWIATLGEIGVKDHAAFIQQDNVNVVVMEKDREKLNDSIKISDAKPKPQKQRGEAR